MERQVAAEILFRRARASPLKRLIAVNSLDANLICCAAPVFVQRRSFFCNLLVRMARCHFG